MKRQGFWKSACRETNEGRQMKGQGFWESACRETNEEAGAAAISVISTHKTNEGRQMKKGD